MSIRKFFHATKETNTGDLHNDEHTGRSWVNLTVGSMLGRGTTEQVDSAISERLTAGVPWVKIASIVIPYLIQAYLSGSLDIVALIKKIKDLIAPPAPAA